MNFNFFVFINYFQENYTTFLGQVDPASFKRVHGPDDQGFNLT